MLEFLFRSGKRISYAHVGVGSVLDRRRWMCDKRMVGLVALILFRVTPCQRSALGIVRRSADARPLDFSPEDAFIYCLRNVPMVLHPLINPRNLQRAIAVRLHNFKVKAWA